MIADITNVKTLPAAPETYSAGLQPLRDEMQSAVTRLMQEEVI